VSDAVADETHEWVDGGVGADSPICRKCGWWEYEAVAVGTPCSPGTSPPLKYLPAFRDLSGPKR